MTEITCHCKDCIYNRYGEECGAKTIFMVGLEKDGRILMKCGSKEKIKITKREKNEENKTFFDLYCIACKTLLSSCSNNLISQQHYYLQLGNKKQIYLCEECFKAISTLTARYHTG